MEITAFRWLTFSFYTKMRRISSTVSKTNPPDIFSAVSAPPAQHIPTLDLVLISIRLPFRMHVLFKTSSDRVLYVVRYGLSAGRKLRRGGNNPLGFHCELNSVQFNKLCNFASNFCCYFCRGRIPQILDTRQLLQEILKT